MFQIIHAQFQNVYVFLHTENKGIEDGKDSNNYSTVY